MKPAEDNSEVQLASTQTLHFQNLHTPMSHSKYPVVPQVNAKKLKEEERNQNTVGNSTADLVLYSKDLQSKFQESAARSNRKRQLQSLNTDQLRALTNNELFSPTSYLRYSKELGQVHKVNINDSFINNGTSTLSPQHKIPSSYSRGLMELQPVWKLNPNLKPRYSVANKSHKEGTQRLIRKQKQDVMSKTLNSQEAKRVIQMFQKNDQSESTKPSTKPTSVTVKNSLLTSPRSKILQSSRASGFFNSNINRSGFLQSSNEERFLQQTDRELFDKPTIASAMHEIQKTQKSYFQGTEHKIQFKSFTVNRGKNQKQSDLKINLNGKDTSALIEPDLLSPSIKKVHVRRSSVVVNKARFKNVVDGPLDTDSLLNMQQIIDSLKNKEGIQSNRVLQYQLRSLENSIKVPQEENNNQPTLKKPQILPFPLQQTELQSKQQQLNQRNDFPQADECLKQLEEIELEMAIENGGNLDALNPILQHYKALCNSIYTLCKEEGLYEILRQALLDKRNRRLQRNKRPLYPGKMSSNSCHKGVKYSAAKDILVSALLKDPHINRNAHKLDRDMIEIEYLQGKVDQLKGILQSEIDNPTKRKQGMKFIDKAEMEINRLLMIARKKKKEREYAKLIEEQKFEEDNDLSKPRSLQSMLKDPKYQETIARRFRVDKEKYMVAQTKMGKHLQEQDIGSGKVLIQEMLRNLEQTKRSEIDNFEKNTSQFLDFLVDNFGSFFLCQKTYCLSEFFDVAPKHIYTYAQNISSLTTTIPLRFSILADQHDDHEFSQSEMKEFIYNRDDILYRMVSQSLRYQSNLDLLGLDKADWIVEVIQKFNVLTLINYMFREALHFLRNTDYEESETDLIRQNSDISESFVLEDNTLHILRQQFARYKYQNKMNLPLVDKILGTQIEVFKQMNKEIRISMYHLCTYEVEDEGTTEILLKDLNPNKVFVILSGSLSVQKQVDSKWSTFHICPAGQILPVQFAYNLYRYYEDVKLVIDHGTKRLEYLMFDKVQMSNCVFRDIKHTIMQKILILQSGDIFGAKTSGGRNSKAQVGGEILSPYISFVMGLVSKVQIFKFCEVIQRQNQAPQSMHIILEGQAQAVFEDLLSRKGDVCEYSRRSMQNHIPKALKFGLNKNQEVISTSPTLRIRSPLRNDKEETFSNAQIIQKRREIKNNVSFQNAVINDNWDHHKVTDKIKYKHHIVFDTLQEGSYFGSRAILDEVQLKNYIKYNSQKLKEQFQIPKNLKHKGELKHFKQNQEEARLSHQYDLQRSYNSFLDDEEGAEEQGEHHKLLEDDFSLNQQLQIEKLDDKDYKLYKQFLQKSQLSIVVQSSQLKLMVINRADKGYFCETIKKLFDERVLSKEFIDTDRPMMQKKEIIKIRGEEKNWDQYKRSFEEECLRRSFYEKFDNKH